MSWQIDYSHSHINFWVRHLMISKVRGRFESFSGTINYDETVPTNTTVDITIEAASIDTKEEQRDNHLKSPDFLDVANFPTLTFKSKEVVSVDEFSGQLIGDLTIHGVTKEVSLEVEFAGQAQTPWGTTSAGFSAVTKINRADWGLVWNKALETGGVLVGDTITIEIEVELVKQPDAVPAATAD